jgi:hypothetical protein
MATELAPPAAPAAPPSPETLAALAGRLERLLDTLEPAAGLLQDAPNMVAIAVDTADAFIRDGRAHGIDVDARLRDTVRLVERLTHPDTVRQLHTLLDRLPALAALAPLVDQAPGVLAEAQRTATPLGVLGTLRALGHPDVQRTVGLALAAAQAAGRAATSPSTGVSRS